MSTRAILLPVDERFYFSSSYVQLHLNSSELRSTQSLFPCQPDRLRRIVGIAAGTLAKRPVQDLRRGGDARGRRCARILHDRDERLERRIGVSPRPLRDVGRPARLCRVGLGPPDSLAG